MMAHRAAGGADANGAVSFGTLLRSLGLGSGLHGVFPHLHVIPYATITVAQ